MTRSLKACLALALIAAFAAGCQSSRTDTTSSTTEGTTETTPAPGAGATMSTEPVTVSLADTASTINLSAGQELVVQLAGPTSGDLVWVLANEADSGMMVLGAPTVAAGSETHRLRAGTATGTSTLRFELKPRTDMNATPTQIVTYTVTVR